MAEGHLFVKRTTVMRHFYDVTFRWTCHTKSSFTTGRLFHSAAPPFLCRSSTPHHESVTWTQIVHTQSIWLDHKIQHSHTTLILVPFQQMFRLYFLHLYSSLMHNRSNMLWPCGPSQGPESFMSPTHRTDCCIYTINLSMNDTNAVLQVEVFWYFSGLVRAANLWNCALSVTETQAVSPVDASHLQGLHLMLLSRSMRPWGAIWRRMFWASGQYVVHGL